MVAGDNGQRKLSAASDATTHNMKVGSFRVGCLYAQFFGSSFKSGRQGGKQRGKQFSENLFTICVHGMKHWSSHVTANAQARRANDVRL